MWDSLDETFRCSFFYKQCQKCYLQEFYTSARSEKGFDINQRINYTMRAGGQIYTGLTIFTTYTDIPKPVAANNYDEIVNKLSSMAKEISGEIMIDAVDKIYGTASLKNDEITITLLSCDGL